MRLQKFLENSEFAEEMHKHIVRILDIILKNSQPFSILTNITNVTFKPELGVQITSKFKPVTMFVLDGYTLSTARVEKNILIFEAGFGDENLGSYVSVPIDSILQIAADNTPILINLSLINKDNEKDEYKSKETGVKRSMEALLLNPKNKNLFKK